MVKLSLGINVVFKGNTNVALDYLYGHEYFNSAVNLGRRWRNGYAMWIFAYGSLMTDGWERRFDCTKRVVARLIGYRRAFGKASVLNWGTRRCPCPTLYLKPDLAAECVGIAFDFPESEKDSVAKYLAEREGKGFELTDFEIIVQNSDPIPALVPFYVGSNILQLKSPHEFVEAIKQAHGTSGACTDYILGIHNELIKLGIQDPLVTELRESLLARE